jgi:hypothetical protein
MHTLADLRYQARSRSPAEHYRRERNRRRRRANTLQRKRRESVKDRCVALPVVVALRACCAGGSAMAKLPRLRPFARCRRRSSLLSVLPCSPIPNCFRQAPGEREESIYGLRCRGPRIARGKRRGPPAVVQRVKASSLSFVGRTIDAARGDPVETVWDKLRPRITIQSI